MNIDDKIAKWRTDITMSDDIYAQVVATEILDELEKARVLLVEVKIDSIVKNSKVLSNQSAHSNQSLLRSIKAFLRRLAMEPREVSVPALLDELKKARALLDEILEHGICNSPCDDCDPIRVRIKDFLGD